MGTLSNVRAKLGLSASFVSSKEGVSGANTLGAADALLKLTAANKFYTRRFVFAPAAELLLDLYTNDTTGSDSFTVGNAQVETATAAGTITTAGNATAIVTSSGMSGSPLTVTFAVALSDTASAWAAKARAALEANATIAARFTVSGTGTSIILTRKPLDTFDVPGGTLDIFAGNDGTLNIALADDTSAGITEAATSANTTAGVASAGVKIYGTDSKDHEGEALGSVPLFMGVRFEYSGFGATMSVNGDAGGNIFDLSHGEDFCRASASALNVSGSYVITAGSVPSALTITVVGSAT